MTLSSNKFVWIRSAWRRRGQRSPLLSKCALRCLRPRKRPTTEESVAPLTWACALLGRNTGTKTKKAERAALKRLKKNLKSIEASGLQAGTAPRCHHACHWRRKSGDESFTRAGVDFWGTLHDCDFAKIKIGLNVIQISGEKFFPRCLSASLRSGLDTMFLQNVGNGFKRQQVTEIGKCSLNPARAQY